MQWELSLVKVVEEVLILQKRVGRLLEECLLVDAAVCVLRIELLLTWVILMIFMHFTSGSWLMLVELAIVLRAALGRMWWR